MSPPGAASKTGRNHRLPRADHERHEESKVSWPRDAFEALRQIVLIENRINTMTDTVKELAVACQEMDRRLIRLEAKFELLERMATPSRRALPEKSEK